MAKDTMNTESKVFGAQVPRGRRAPAQRRSIPRTLAPKTEGACLAWGCVDRKAAADQLEFDLHTGGLSLLFFKAQRGSRVRKGLSATAALREPSRLACTKSVKKR